MSPHPKSTRTFTTSTADTEVTALAGASSAPLEVALRAEGMPWQQYVRAGDSTGKGFEIGSVSKVLTGALLGVLVEAGEVDPETPVDHLTGQRLPWPGRPPTLVELATHRSGLPNTPARLRWREAAIATGMSRKDPWRRTDAAAYQRHLARAASRARTEGRFLYSSMGVGLLADALAASTGHPFAELIDQRLLRPLKMNRTNLDRPELGQEVVVTPQNRRGESVPYLRDHMPGAGMFASTLDDLQLLLDALRSPRDGDPVISGLQRSITPQHHIREGLSIGYCWLIEENENGTIVHHNGGTWGSQAHVSLHVDRGRAVVALSGTYRDLDGFAFRFLGAS
ncbi:D-alanyl-D-alanine-carboxypeptidase/endopeptidase AmpH precursor [Microbacterium oxydans]|uniref:Beta-lactamase n=1 Tax=Microbacterium oxydans TaxID=82380 RepID=A0A0F0KHT2_9MICO|nr:serine hydrolase domain-containing protein [Microbacterium oxydans]KJL20418.1 D-alanyl-D-alanine-carboxypeptidase/endopeptidase AmpH precursor [Microbacterium oxydans]